MNNINVINNLRQDSSINNLDLIPDNLLSYVNRENLSSESKRKIIYVLKEFLAIYESKRLTLKYLSKEHFDTYKASLENKVANGYLKISTAQTYLNFINSLSRHLFKNNEINFIFNASLIEKSKKTRNTIPVVIQSFLDDLTAQNYSQINTYKKNIMYFFKFLYQTHNAYPIPESLQENDIKRLDNDHIESYHNFLARKVELNEISLSRALNLLRCLKLFIQYFRRLNIICFKYGIPDRFQTQHSRNNEFVPTNETIKLVDAIIDYSKMPERDLTIFLIILDTGCRPLEITNMEIHDVFTSESAVIFRSKKSGQRKLKLSKQVMEVLKKYLMIRKKLDSKYKSLFLSNDNQPLSVNAIGHIYSKANIKVYGKKRYTAKSYRHAYATNALENKNDFDKVSKSMGHLHWISTQYYLEKSIKRLKRNTLKHNPVKYL